MRIFLEPSDTLLFRTGRPFDAGEVGYAETLFPPTPETLQGAIRAMLATHWNPKQLLSQVFAKGSDLVKLIGDRDGYGRFRITDICLGYRKKEDDIELLYPVPTHLLKNDKGRFRLLPKDPQEGVSSNIPKGMKYLYPHPYPPNEADGKLEPIDGWLTEINLHKALSPEACLSKIEVVTREKIYKYESRLGIGMENATKATRDGMLYSMQMIRMQLNYGFVVNISLTSETDAKTLLSDDTVQNTLKLPDQGWATLGGEQRAVRFTVLKTPSSQQGFIQHKGQNTLLYLATPAAFQDGWRPRQWPENLPAPVAAAIPRYQSIGGWKLNPENSGGSNKCMRRCVPAGSVYFFDGSFDIPRTFTNYGEEIGYGITVRGEW